MTPNTLARHLFTIHGKFRCSHLTPGNCKHGEVIPELLKLVSASNGLLTVGNLGSSLEGRSISLVTAGDGRKKVLLWSQMHGDETTATLALMDIFSFLAHVGAEEEWVRKLLAEATLFFVPLLNPDGAERADRRTAVGIDMNRDARDLATPEARLLRDAQRRLKPSFGFNLHDQELSSAGESTRVTALALLAPAADKKKAMTPVRLRAMRIAAILGRTLGQLVDGHLARYDDAFEARAFGDNMQLWGTSTVLIESGHWPDDPQKNFIRRLNFAGILTALFTIGNGSYQDADLDYYRNLPPNMKRMFDVIIRGVRIRHPGGWSHAADIGLTFDPLCNRGSSSAIATIKEVGDLSMYGALRTFEGKTRTVKFDMLLPNQSLPLQDILDVLQLPHG